MRHQLGTIYKHPQAGDILVLAQVDACKVALVSIIDGNRLNDPHPVEFEHDAAMGEAAFISDGDFSVISSTFDCSYIVPASASDVSALIALLVTQGTVTS